MHPSQPAGLEAGEELAPELEGLAVPDRGAQHLAGALDGHPGGHDQGLGHHVRPDADLAEGGIAEHVGELGVGQCPGAECLDLAVQTRADPRHLGY